MILGPEHVSEAGSRKLRSAVAMGRLFTKVLRVLLHTFAVVLLLSRRTERSQSTKLVAPFRLAGTVGQY